MLPFLISKTKILPSKSRMVKEKSFYVSGDNLAAIKTRRFRRKPVKLSPMFSTTKCDCNSMHLTKIVITYAPKSRKRGASNIVLSMTAWGTTSQRKRMKLPSVKLAKKVKVVKEKPVLYDSQEFFKKLENQLKALNLGKSPKAKAKGETPAASQRSKTEKEVDGGENSRVTIDEDEGDEGELKRRGKRRRKGGPKGSDRLTSAGLAAQAQQDPETQIAGIGTDSQNPSSRGSIAPDVDDDIIPLPSVKPVIAAKKCDSFIDDDILKFLHREVDQDAIETEFNRKRRYVLEEALRTRPARARGPELLALLKELKVPAVSLGDWLHIPRVFSRKNAQFGLPIDTNALETLSPMNYASRFVSIQKSKQLLYITVLRKFRERGYRMPIKDIEEGLMLMMGGILTAEKAAEFKNIMEWDDYFEEECAPDEIKLTLLNYDKHVIDESGDGESDENTLKFRTWCGLCAVCERMYGRFPSRDKDPPDGIELSDFTMIESKLTVLKIHKGLVEILSTIKER